MPLTPLHLGPGALFKAIGGSGFSFLVFGGSQVLMDMEPLIKMMRGDAVIHGPSHTILGALIIGCVGGVLGRPISKIVLQRIGVPHHTLSWRVSFVSALAGTYSHIGLDAIMHKDMNPFWPIAHGNVFLGLLTVMSLNLACLMLGVAGAAIMAIRTLRARKTS